MAPVAAHRILVVENDPNVRGSLVDDLRRTGYEIHEAESTLEAAVRLRKQLFDLMVADLDVPGMADSTLKIISELFPWMLVIGLGGGHAGYADLETQRMMRHLPKPIQFNEFRKVVTSALQEQDWGLEKEASKR